MNSVELAKMKAARRSISQATHHLHAAKAALGNGKSTHDLRVAIAETAAKAAKCYADIQLSIANAR